MTSLWFRKGDTVVTAYAERASGPGWSNRLLWVIVRNVDGRYRQVCLQPEDQTPDMYELYNVSESAHLSMTHAVKLALAKPRHRR